MPAIGEFNPSRHKIDRLPDLQRKAVIDAILRGDPLRSIAKMAGCTFNHVKRYRDTHIVPKLRLTPQIDYLSEPMESTTYEPVQNEQVNTSPTVQSNQHVTSDTVLPVHLGTRSMLRASPVKRRAESLWRFTAGALMDARRATRNTAHPDFSPLAPLLNQAHKNLEIQGKLSGELATAGSGGAPSVAIQIVMPSAEGPSTVDIDVMGAQIGLKSGQR